MKRPNIVLLYTDQQRWDALGANGNSDIQTPNIDRLAASGLNCDRFFVQNPVCMPSRVSMLSGMYPSTLGIVRNGVPVPKETVILPHLLRNYGYHCANIGKLHFLPHANRDHRTPHPAYGFDHLEISDEPGCYADAYRSWVQMLAPDALDAVSVGLPPATAVWQEVMQVQDGIRHPEQRFPKRAIPFAGPAERTHSAFVAEQTVSYIEEHREVPFFCIAGFYSPHSPWVAPQRFIDLYDPASLSLPRFPEQVDQQRSETRCSDQELRAARQGYYAQVSEVDHHLGHILDCLQDLNLAEDTIVVYTSDHGEWLGEHLRYGKGYPAHDCISRVPLVVRWTRGVWRPGRTWHGFVEAVDLVPTLLECAGIPVPGHLQGRSFHAQLAGTGGPTRSCALTEGDGWKTLRLEGLRYVLDANGDEALYDLQLDPDGYTDISGEARATESLARARHALLQQLLARERPLPRAWAY